MAVLTPPPVGSTSTARERTSEARTWLPALDGLRGLAVAAVLAFHGGWRWAEGGYLGVSVFFTLSGFLVARIVLGARGRAAGSLVSFWGRRIQRLAPALALLVLGVGVAAWARRLPTISADLAGDLVAGVAQVANWRFISQGQAYGDLFEAPSPLLHLWSLSVEVQLYLVVPVLLVALGATRRRVMTGVVGVLGLLVLTTTVVPMSASRAYYATDVRAIEFLAGVLVGAWLAFGHRPGPAARRAVSLASPVALAFLGLASATWAVGDLAIDRGALVAVAVASSVVVAAGALDVGPVTRLLSWGPLGWLGRISYGLYLYHWPVFILLSPARTGLDGISLFGLRVAISLALAVTSHVLVELPLRSGQPVRLPPRALVAATAASLLVALVVVPGVDRAISIEAAAAALPQLEEEAPAPVVDTGPSRVLMVGDSQAVRLATGLRIWGAGDPRVISAADLGCGIGRGGEVRYHDWQRAIFDDCTLWRADFPELAARLSPDLVLVMTGPWDFADRRLTPDDEWRRPGDPVYDEYLLGELVAAGERLADVGAPVVWLTAAEVDVGRRDVLPPRFPAGGVERTAALNALLATAADRNGATVLDYSAFLATCPGGVLDADVRPDGVHLERDSAVTVAEWLGPQLLELMDAAAPPGAAPPRATCVSP